MTDKAMRPLMVLALLLAAQPASADPCAPLGAFATGGPPPALLPVAAECSTSIAIGGTRSTDCHWSFGFREEAATAAYADLTDLLRSCADRAIEVQAMQVNHPDTFDQVLAVIAGHPVSLSLKDKAAMGKTLIFLRREDEAPGD